MKIKTKTVAVANRKIKSKITVEHMEDLKMFHSLYSTGFYMLKEYYDPILHINNKIYSILNFDNNYIAITINQIAYDRLIKINKLMKTESNIIDHINLFNKHKIENIVEHMLAQELANNINTEIVKKLKSLE